MHSEFVRPLEYLHTLCMHVADQMQMSSINLMKNKNILNWKCTEMEMHLQQLFTARVKVEAITVEIKIDMRPPCKLPSLFYSITRQITSLIIGKFRKQYQSRSCMNKSLDFMCVPVYFFLLDLCVLWHTIKKIELNWWRNRPREREEKAIAIFHRSLTWISFVRPFTTYLCLRWNREYSFVAVFVCACVVILTESVLFGEKFSALFKILVWIYFILFDWEIIHCQM